MVVIPVVSPLACLCGMSSFPVGNRISQHLYLFSVQSDTLYLSYTCSLLEPQLNYRLSFRPPHTEQAPGSDTAG